MFATHMKNLEQVLLKQYEIPSGAGHTIHKGAPREAFVQNFLENHLPSLVDIGTGEIIDSNSMPDESRNQHDIVVYQRSLPKLHFADNISAFLIESVSATIEVKSILDEDAVRQAIGAAYKVKAMKRAPKCGITLGGDSNTLFCGVVAYTGPAKMKTVLDWVSRCEAEVGIRYDGGLKESLRTRNIAAPSLDSIVLLGKGVAYSAGQSCGIALEDASRSHCNWISVESADYNNLGLFFLQMLSVVGTVRLSCCNFADYLHNMTFSGACGVP